MTEAQKFSKAVINNRLKSFVQRLALANESLPPKPTKDQVGTFSCSVSVIEQELNKLTVEIQESLKKETTLEWEYSKELVELTLKDTREKVLKRLCHQPVISAALDMFCMLFETELLLHATWMNLRTCAAVEDRMGPNSQFYKVDGTPKKTT